MFHETFCKCKIKQNIVAFMQLNNWKTHMMSNFYQIKVMHEADQRINQDLHLHLLRGGKAFSTIQGVQWLLWLKLQIMSPSLQTSAYVSVSFQHARLSQSQRSIAAPSNQIISAGANHSLTEIWALVSSLSNYEYIQNCQVPLTISDSIW